MKSDSLLVYIGTYTSGQSEGIYVYRLDLSSGALEFSSKATGVEHPSYLAIDSKKRCLYAANEIPDPPGGFVSAFAIDPATGALSFTNKQSSHDTYTCHLIVDRTDRFVLAVGYGNGFVCAYPIQAGGRLGEASHVLQHQDSDNPAPNRKGPHAHCIIADAANRYFFVPDLGLDKIMIYQLDLEQGRLNPNPHQPWVRLKTGAGPRHFTFHSSGQYAYVINETNCTITAYAYDAARGALAELQTAPTLPADFSGRNSCADIQITPSGRFLYGSNRGHDSLVIYAIAPATGKLSYAGCESTLGKTPRGFAIDPTGAFLLAANQSTDTVVTFRIDPDTGALTPTGHVAQVPTPVCLKMIYL